MTLESNSSTSSIGTPLLGTSPQGKGKKRFGFYGIQTRLTALVMVLTIPLLIGIFIYISSRAGSEIENQALEHLRESTDSVSANVTTWLDLHVRSLKGTTYLPGIISMSASQQKPIMESISQAYPNLFLVHTLNLSGMDIARSDTNNLTDYSDRFWFQQAKNGVPITYEVVISRTINKPVLSISAPILKGEEVVGVVGYTSELTEISDEVISYSEGSSLVFIVDEKNRVVMHPDPSFTTGELRDLSTFPPIAALSQGTIGYFNFTDESGAAWRSYVDRLPNGWGIITQQREDELLAPVREFATIAGFLILLASIAMGALVWFAIRRLLQPIGDLTRTASAIAAGDLNRVAEVKSADEIGLLAATFNNMTGRLRELFGTLEDRVSERTKSLELAAEVSRAVSQVRDLDAMLKDAAELIRSRFELYYVQVYLTDASQRHLILKSGTGSVGEVLLSYGHRLPMQSTSINGRAAIEKRSVVVSDTNKSATFKPNPLLPETRSEMAVPLMIGDKVVGVLDLQSNEPGALNQDVLSAFEALAGQLAIAIQNSVFLAEAREAQAEVAAQAQRTSRANWTDYLDAIHKPEFLGFVYEGDQILPIATPSEVAPAVEENRNAFVAPISITGEELGNVVVELEGESPITRTEELLQGVARQVAQQMENLRLLESAERARAEAEKASRLITREGWQELLEAKGGKELGYVYNLSTVQPITPEVDTSLLENALALPLKVRDEAIGKLVVQGISPDDEQTLDLVHAVTERLGLHIESLRQQSQTRSALEQTEKLSAASLRLSQATDLQDMLKIVNETLAIPAINRILMGVYNYNAANEMDSMTIAANWWSGNGLEPTPVGTQYTFEQLNATQLFLNPEPLISNDTHNDERVTGGFLQVVNQLKLRAMASMPLFVGGNRVGVLLLESEEPHNFTTADIRLITAMAPQVATILENRRQFERAQKQAERQSMLNIISQKIQSATTVEAVLQIAARELGHALGAPRTIAQLSIKDKK